MLTAFLNVLFHSADTIIVGRFAGSTPMAAVGSTGSLIMLIVNLFSGLSAGTNVMAARFYGSREYDKVSLVFPRDPRAEVLYLCFPISWLLTLAVTAGVLLVHLRRLNRHTVPA